MEIGQRVMAAPKHRQEADPWLSMLSLEGTLAQGSEWRPDPVKPQKAVL